MNTVDVNGFPFDLGATWLHGRTSDHNPLLNYTSALEELPLPAKMKRGGELRCVQADTEEVVNTAAVNKCVRAYHDALEQCADCMRAGDATLGGSVGAGTMLGDVAAGVSVLLAGRLAPSCPGDLARDAFAWRALLECSISGCDSVSDLSLPAWGEYDEPPGAVAVSTRWRGGYSALIDAALKSVEAADVRVGCRATSIQLGTGAGPKVICTAEGRRTEVEADHVLVTVSLGVLKRSVQGVGLTFDPPLPDAKIKSIQRLAFGTVDKVLLLYETPWWEGHWTSLRLLWTAEELKVQRCGEGDGVESASSPVCASTTDNDWTRGVYSFTPAKSVTGLECWFSGPSARTMERVSDDDVINKLHALLARLSGTPEVPSPSRVLRSRWFENLDICGSYSFVPVGASGSDIDEFAAPVGDKCDLLFAGEHTHRSYYSTVHGAWWSGQRAADTIIQAHSPPDDTEGGNSCN